MLRIKIILTILIPTFCLLGLLFSSYVSSEMKHRILETQEDLKQRITEYGLDLTQNSREISREVATFASLLGLPSRNNLYAHMKNTFNEMPMICGFCIAYDPEFMQQYHEGKYREYQLETFDKLFTPDKNDQRFAFSVCMTLDGVLRNTDESRLEYTYKDWYLVPRLLQKGMWTEPFMTRIDRTMVCAYGFPFYYQGKIAGIVTCFVLLDALTRSAKEGYNSDLGIEGSRYFILDDSGKILYHSKVHACPHYSLYSSAEQLEHKEIFPKIDAIINANRGIVKLPYLGNTPSDSVDQEGDTWFVHTVIRNGADWTLVGAFEEKTVMTSHYGHFLVLGIFVFVTGLILSVVLSVLIIRANEPILAMIETARYVSQGNLDVAVPEKYTQRKGEFGVLVKTFNEMIEHLRENFHRLVDEAARRTVLEMEMARVQGFQRLALPLQNTISLEQDECFIDARLTNANYIADDYFDYWRLPDGRIAFLIVDVPSRGVTAALEINVVRTMVHHLTESCDTPGRIISEINRGMYHSNINDMFVSLFFAFYQPQTGELQYCNAGHNPPVIVQEDGTISVFPYADNDVVGIFPGLEYKTDSFFINRGELLFICTSGVMETQSQTGEVFGRKNLVRILSRLAYESPNQFISAFMERLERFRNNVPVDDNTIFILKRNQENHA